MIQLEIVKHKYGFDRGLRASLKNMKNININIPYTDDEFIDIEKQKEIIEKYECLTELKFKVKEYKKLIEELNIKIETNYKFSNFKFNDLFKIISGNSKLTKNFVNQNEGEYVVYSANTKENGIFGYINSYDYEKECIQITTNGIYAGTVFYRPKHKFSINGDAKILIILYENLDYYFLYYELKNVFSENKFDWENKPTLSRLNKLSLSVPVLPSGDFDLVAQKEIASRYKKIEEIKTVVINELDKIIDAEIEFD